MKYYHLLVLNHIDFKLKCNSLIKNNISETMMPVSLNLHAIYLADGFSPINRPITCILIIVIVKKSDPF